MSASQPDLDTLKELLAALPYVVLLIGEDRKIHFINRMEAGRAVAEIVGSDAMEGVPQEDRAGAAAAIERVFETREPVQRVTEIVGADGQSQWYEGSLLPIVRADRVAYVAIASSNVTERMLAERELGMLQSLLPLCSWCKKVRDDEGEWRTLEAYLEEMSHSRVTHGMCPDCERRMMEEKGGLNSA